MRSNERESKAFTLPNTLAATRGSERQRTSTLQGESDILPLMQSLLATLADIDFAHECELERFSNSGLV